ncbi:MAG: hypothetical protein AB7P76_08740 [Candidatus Melainabacteria bacterium]
MELNSTFIFVLVSFVLFMLALRSLYFQPIQAVKQLRAHKLEQSRQQAADYLSELGTLGNDYEAELARARQEAQKVIQTAQKTAKDSAHQKISTARQEAQNRVTAQLSDLKAWHEETYTKLTHERSNLVQLIIAKVTGNAVPVQDAR